MAIVESNLVEESLYGQEIPADEGVTLAITTVNRTLKVSECDAFDVESLTLVDRNTTVMMISNIETGARFKVTYEFQEEENNDE